MKAGSERFAVVFVVLMATTVIAHAQPSAQSAAATAQFDKGRALMKDKKYAEACAAFEQSQKLEAQFGTQFNLADCYNKLGKLASAWLTYKELSQRDSNDGRKRESTKRAKELDKRLPKLLLKAASPPAGLVVTMNGSDVTSLVGIDSPVDLGDYKIRAKAPGYADFEAATKITDEGKTVTLAIELEKSAGKADPIAKQPDGATRPAIRKQPDGERETRDERPPPRSRRRTYAVIAGIGGVALVATGLVFGNVAKGKWSDAKALCGDDLTCDNATDLERGNGLVDDARLSANVSTALLIGGGVAITIGAVLWFTAPSNKSTSTALRIAPHAGGDTVGLTLGGRF